MKDLEEVFILFEVDMEDPDSFPREVVVGVYSDFDDAKSVISNLSGVWAETSHLTNYAYFFGDDGDYFIEAFPILTPGQVNPLVTSEWSASE